MWIRIEDKYRTECIINTNAIRILWGESLVLDDRTIVSLDAKGRAMIEELLKVKDIGDVLAVRREMEEDR